MSITGDPEVFVELAIDGKNQSHLVNVISYEVEFAREEIEEFANSSDFPAEIPVGNLGSFALYSIDDVYPRMEDRRPCRDRLLEGRLLSARSEVARLKLFGIEEPQGLHKFAHLLTKNNQPIRSGLRLYPSLNPDEVWFPRKDRVLN